MKTLIIAEAGVNHNGNLDLALEMIRRAAAFGADIIKFQSFTADDLVTRDAPKAEYQKITDGEDSQYAMLRKLELDSDAFRTIYDECRRAGITFMSTPFSLNSARMLNSLGMKWWKIASGEITNLPLLEYVGSVADKVILSTGMSTMSEIKDAVDTLCRAGVKRDNLYLLHCTTAYPTPPDDVNLRAMDALRSFGTAGVGYSDHTQGTAIAVAAVAMGACVIEKHFTTDRNLPGPDHRASLTPDEFGSMVRDIRTVEKALGSERKEPSPAEKPNIGIARKSIVALRQIAKGETFSDDNLTAKRPGGGISPMRWHDLTGRKAGRDYAADEQISENELL